MASSESSDSGSYERLGAKLLSLPDVIAQSIGFIGPVFSSAFVIPLVVGVISASGKGGGVAAPLSVLIAAVGVFALGWPYETSACMVRLVYSGCFDRYPGLRVITHHAGAMVPHFSGRLASPLEDPDRTAIYGRLKADPMDYFRRFYADTALFGAPHAVQCVLDFFGPDHVLFGTDMPLGPSNAVEATIADIESCEASDERRAAVFAGNATRLLIV